MNILDIVKNYLPGNLAAQISGSTGENEAGISKVIKAAIPAVLSGLINKSSNDPGGVLDMVKSAAHSGVLSNLGGLAGRNEMTTSGGFNIWSALRSLFGDKLEDITGMLAGFGGVKTATAEQALGATSAAALGAVGKYAEDKNMDAAGLSSFLASQKGIISSLIPAGFDFSKIGSWLGIGSLGTAAAAAVSEFTAPPAEPISYAAATQKKGGNNWLVPLVILAALGGLIWWMTKDGCNKSTTVSNTSMDTTVTTVAADTDNTGTTTTVAAKESIVLTLPSGATINAYKGGIEDQLIQFIQSDEYKNAADDEALKNRWFNFDNLNFEFGTTKLTDSSKVQLNNIVAILKEFKQANIKIGTYTDKKGDDAANLKLSQGRADAVKAALDKAGVSSQVKGAEGYGEKFAAVPETESDEARAIDRKVAVRLVK
ncbi:Photosystem I chlorophyll a apoprotein A2 [compost metagenome]